MPRSASFIVAAALAAFAASGSQAQVFPALPLRPASPAAPPPQAPSPAAAASAAEGLAVTGSEAFEVVPLKYADVSEIVGLLTGNQTIKPNDSFTPEEPA